MIGKRNEGVKRALETPQLPLTVVSSSSTLCGSTSTRIGFSRNGTRSIHNLPEGFHKKSRLPLAVVIVSGTESVKGLPGCFCVKTIRTSRFPSQYHASSYCG